MKRVLWLLMILFVPALGIAREEAEPEKLVNLRESWTKAKGVGARPIKEGYLTSLMNLRENFTKSNRLEGALLVREEIEILTQGKARDPEDDNTKGPTQLLELRKSYQREMARLTATKDRIYLGALDKMQRRFSGQGQLEAAVAVKAEIDKVRSEGIVPKKSAEIFVVCDDYAEIALNGQVIAKCAAAGAPDGRLARAKLVDLREGDIIAVRVINHGGPYGFASVVKLPSGESIATSTSTWKTFKPTKGTVWCDPEGFKSVKRAKGGTNHDWKGKVESETGVACDSIWGEGNSTYVMLEIPRLR